MRPVVALCLVLASCAPPLLVEECSEMSQSVTASFKGLVLQPNQLGEIPDGALEQADNVVVSREGIVEPRRGTEEIATKAATKLSAFKGELLGHGGSTLSHSPDGAAWSDYSGSITAQSDAPLRTAEAVGNVYVTAAEGVKRLDTIAGTPELAGVPGGLDVEATQGATGTAVPNNTSVAYRVLFGKKDANGRLLLGAPSGRATYTNTSGAVKDATVSFSLPRGLDSSHLFQVYRSRASVDQNTDPGDELGLVLEGTVPTAKSITQLSRTTNVVTATTSTAHGYSVGQIVQVSPGGSAGGGHVFAVGSNAVNSRSSDNGATWSSAGISGLPVGTYYAGASSNSAGVVVGTDAATSSDGLTWVDRAPIAGTWRAVAYGNGRFVAVGDGGATMYSTDNGATWSAGGPLGVYGGTAVIWDGSQFVACAAVGTSGGIIYTSADGGAWTNRQTFGGNYVPKGIAFNGTRYVVAFNGGTNGLISSATTIGGTWDGPLLSGQPDVRAVGWTGSAFVVVGNLGVAYYSATGAAGSWASVALAGDYRATTGVIAVGVNVAATCTANGQTWTTRTIAAGTYNAVLTGGGAVFSAGEYTLTGVPLTTTFTYAETGTDGTLVQPQAAEPLSGAATDTAPDGFLGAYLYTNQNTGDGIGNANDRPPLSKDVAAFRDTLFLLNFSSPAYGEAFLLSVGGSNGLQSGDTVTVNGLVYTAGVSESISGRTFKLTTTGSVSANITATAQSLIRVVNRSLSSGVTLVDVSDPSGVPGQIGFRSSSAASALAVTFSRSTAWSPAAGISKAPTVHKNGLAYSKPSEPDHVPLALTQLPVKVGSQDKAGLRLTPIRDSVLLWKEDGLWKVTGGAGSWSVDPLDPTVWLVAPESAVALNGSVYALTNQGVVRASEAGVEIVSRGIEPVLMPLLAPAMKATTARLARAVAYESDRKYLLWLPTSSSDTECTQAYVYDVITNAWTKRTDPAADVIVNPADDRLYKVTAGKVRRERKTLTAADYQEDTGVAFPIVIQPVPKFGGNPGALHVFQEVVWMFKSIQFATATASFATNITPSWGDVPLSGSDYGCSAAAAPSIGVRVPVPQEHARGSQLASKWTQSKAGGDLQLQGHSLVFRTCSTRVAR